MENFSILFIFGVFCTTLPYLAVQSFMIARADQPLGYLLSTLLSFCATAALIQSPSSQKTVMATLAALGCILAAIRNSRTRR